MENLPVNPEETPQEFVEINGKKYRKVDSGYTVREYFSHSTEEKGPGPGWDSRGALLDDEWAQSRIGRTFSNEEVYGSPRTLLPDTPYYRLEAVEEEANEE